MNPNSLSRIYFYSLGLVSLIFALTADEFIALTSYCVLFNLLYSTATYQLLRNFSDVGEKETQNMSLIGASLANISFVITSPLYLNSESIIWSSAFLTWTLAAILMGVTSYNRDHSMRLSIMLPALTLLVLVATAELTYAYVDITKELLRI